MCTQPSVTPVHCFTQVPVTTTFPGVGCLHGRPGANRPTHDLDSAHQHISYLSHRNSFEIPAAGMLKKSRDATIARCALSFVNCDAYPALKAALRKQSQYRQKVVQAK